MIEFPYCQVVKMLAGFISPAGGIFTYFVGLVALDSGAASKRRVMTRNDAPVVIDHADEIIDGVPRSSHLRQVRRQIQIPRYENDIKKRKEKNQQGQTDQSNKPVIMICRLRWSVVDPTRK